MIDRRSISHFDWTLFTAVLALTAVGMLAVYSATHSMGAAGDALFRHQAYLLVAGYGVMFAMLIFDYKVLSRLGYVFYALAVLLLVGVLVAGREGMGAQRWLPLGPFSFQPSEVVKLMLIFTLARYFSEDGITGGHTLKDLIKPFILVMVPVGLVVKQPDLGTALMLVFIFCGMAAVAGVRLKSFLYLVGTSALVMPVAWSFFWDHLKDYQKKRILVFISPDIDPSGAGYHITQSKIAIGSGALTGKGYLNGTQSQLSFLPERHTDFIFSVVSEEWGFIGSMLVLVIFLFIILWGIETAYKSKDRFGVMLAVGIVSMLSFYVIINVGMTLGIMPVVGLPLPLVSYGGTSAITTMMALGILINVNLRRFRNL